MRSTSSNVIQPWDYEKEHGVDTPVLKEALRLKLRTLKKICITELIYAAPLLDGRPNL
jgi:hypothetical protein